MTTAIVKDAWRLVDDKNQPVNKGDRFDDRDGFKFIVSSMANHISNYAQHYTFASVKVMIQNNLGD
jgi:hypothetical protein